MKKTKKRRVKVNLILGLIVVILVGIMIYCIFDIFINIKTKTQTTVEVLDKIEGYDYELNENDSAYFKSLFTNLKEALETEEIDEEEYASLVSQLFISDFYSLDCSLNKNDIGGIQFVYTPYQQDFVSKAKTSVYNYVENNIYGDRKQELPMVTEVTVDDIKVEEYSFENDITDSNAYVVNVSIKYEKELNYPKEVTLVLIHNENKLEIAQMK